MYNTWIYGIQIILKGGITPPFFISCIKPQKFSGKIFSQTLLFKTTPTPLEKTEFSGKN